MLVVASAFHIRVTDEDASKGDYRGAEEIAFNGADADSDREEFYDCKGDEVQGKACDRDPRDGDGAHKNPDCGINKSIEKAEHDRKEEIAADMGQLSQVGDFNARQYVVGKEDDKKVIKQTLEIAHGTILEPLNSP